MKVAVIARLDNRYLLLKGKKKNRYEILACSCSERKLGLSILKEKLSGMGIIVDIVDDFLESEEDKIEVYFANVIGYSRSKNDEIEWIDLENICSIEFEDWCANIKDRLDKIATQELKINKLINDEIMKICDAMQIPVDIFFDKRKISVWVKNELDDYCPYIFSIEYEIEDSKDVSIINCWGIKRFLADGEKSDLYVLFANSMNLILRDFFGKYTEIFYTDHIGIGEIGGAIIVRRQIVGDRKSTRLNSSHL